MTRITLIAAAALVAAACTPQERVAGGALAGGAVGAGVGAAATGDAGGALVGGAVGAGAGALAGAATQQRCTGYDRYGRAYEYAC